LGIKTEVEAFKYFRNKYFTNTVSEMHPGWVRDKKSTDKLEYPLVIRSNKEYEQNLDSILNQSCVTLLKGFIDIWKMDKSLYTVESINERYGHCKTNWMTQQSEVYGFEVDYKESRSNPFT
jgi:hypothetical protein